MTRAKDISKIVTDADLSGTLDVTGTVTAGGLTLAPSQVINLNSGADSFDDILRNESENATIINARNNVRINLDSNSDSTNAEFVIGYNGTNTTTAKALSVGESGDISFYEDTGTTPKLFWDASAERLKIGDSSAFTAGGLVVGSDTGGVITVTKNGGTYAQDDLIGSLNWYTEDASLDGPNVTARIAAFANGVSGDDAYLTFSTKAQPLGADAAESMRIDSSGNVGIGTSSPSGKFQVDGGRSYFSADSDAFALYLRYNTSTAGVFVGSPSTDTFTVSRSGGQEHLRIDSSGNVGIGTTSPSAKLEVSGASNSTATFIKPQGALPDNNDNAGLYVLHQGTAGTGLRVRTDNALTGSNFAHILVNNASASINAFQVSQYGSGYIADFNKSGTTCMRIDSSGNVGIGTSSPSLSTASGSATGLEINGSVPAINLKESGGDEFLLYGGASSATIYTVNNLRFLMSGSEKMRITSSGNVGVGKTSTLLADEGVNIFNDGRVYGTVDGDDVFVANRLSNDGNLIRFFQNSSEEGNISVSGTTVSYNGGHLSRWSQLTTNTKDESIVKGTVMTNLDQMAEWTTDGVTEDNEQLNCMAVSSVEGDANVAGVFVNWDKDDDIYTNDMNIAMTGDMVIRIAQGTTVARGDLLMSAGDGTAKPQDDDIVRSKTIAKVTSTNVSHTYDDGTYLVPCVLMAC